MQFTQHVDAHIQYRMIFQLVKLRIPLYIKHSDSKGIGNKETIKVQSFTKMEVKRTACVLFLACWIYRTIYIPDVSSFKINQISCILEHIIHINQISCILKHIIHINQISCFLTTHNTYQSNTTLKCVCCSRQQTRHNWSRASLIKVNTVRKMTLVSIKLLAYKTSSHSCQHTPTRGLKPPQSIINPAGPPIKFFTPMTH